MPHACHASLLIVEAQSCNLQRYLNTVIAIRQQSRSHRARHGCPVGSKDTVVRNSRCTLIGDIDKSRR
jgi:hypothetical protein